MSIIDTFDPNPEAILMPRHHEHTVRATGPMPETVIVTFRKAVTEMVQQRYAPEIIGQCSLGRTIFLYRFEHGGKPLGFYNTIVGGAANAALLEQAIAMGARRFVIFGTCGALYPALTAGHFILPTQAYRDEGVSYHYAPASDWMEVPTASRLAAIFDALGLPYTLGKTWTTDAIYRETPRNAERRREQGCIAVEMECASLMAVALFRGAEVYQFLYAEDCLDGDAWDARGMGSEPQDLRERCLDVALDVAAQL